MININSELLFLLYFLSGIVLTLSPHINIDVEKLPLINDLWIYIFTYTMSNQDYLLLEAQNLSVYSINCENSWTYPISVQKYRLFLWIMAYLRAKF